MEERIVENIDNAAQRAVTDTLENLAFMEAFPVPEDISPGQALMTAALLFHEPQQGEIRIAMPPTLLKKISQTVFGLPAEGTAVPEPKDLLAELLNTIAGRFLIELLPADLPFRIGLPELDPPAACGADPCAIWHFRADDHLFTISVSNLISIHPLRTGI
jgi:hypothetical protein